MHDRRCRHWHFVRDDLGVLDARHPLFDRGVTMNSDLALLITLLKEDHLIKVALKFDMNLLHAGADHRYFMEPATRLAIRSMLPRHIRLDCGPIVDIEQIDEAHVVERST